MTLTARQLHDAIDVACDLIADDLYDLPHTPADNVDQLTAQILAHMVAVHVRQTTNPAAFLERVRQGQHQLVNTEEQR